MIPEAAIKMENLTKLFGEDTVAVDSINLSIPSNSVFALLGPNGVGKTWIIMPEFME